jgi:hypothetical protein
LKDSVPPEIGKICPNLIDSIYRRIFMENHEEPFEIYSEEEMEVI